MNEKLEKIKGLMVGSNHGLVQACFYKQHGGNMDLEPHYLSYSEFGYAKNYEELIELMDNVRCEADFHEVQYDVLYVSIWDINDEFVDDFIIHDDEF